MPLEQISRLVGHSGTSVTEAVYRKQIRPVIDSGQLRRAYTCQAGRSRCGVGQLCPQRFSTWTSTRLTCGNAHRVEKVELFPTSPVHARPWSAWLRVPSCATR